MANADEIDLVQLERAVKSARRTLLNYFELRYRSSQEWPEMRARILEVFGSDGIGRLLKGTGRDDETNWKDQPR